MELSCEKVSAWLQPATAGHARLVLSKTVLFFCTSLYTLLCIVIISCTSGANPDGKPPHLLLRVELPPQVTARAGDLAQVHLRPRLPLPLPPSPVARDGLRVPLPGLSGRLLHRGLLHRAEDVEQAARRITALFLSLLFRMRRQGARAAALGVAVFVTLILAYILS